VTYTCVTQSSCPWRLLGRSIRPTHSPRRPRRASSRSLRAVASPQVRGRQPAALLLPACSCRAPSP